MPTITQDDSEEDAITSLPTSKAKYRAKIETLKAKGKIDDFMAKEAYRLKMLRKNMNPERKKHYNDMAKLRMAKFRARQKEVEVSVTLTRSERVRFGERRQQLRDYNKMKKKESRERAKARRNLLDELEATEAPMEEDAIESEEDATEDQTNLTMEEAIGSDPGEHDENEALGSDQEQCHESEENRSPDLPQTPVRWLKVLDGIITKATPNKRALLKAAGTLNTPDTKRIHQLNANITEQVKRSLAKLKKKRDKHSRIVRASLCVALQKCKKYHKMKEIRKRMGIPWCKLFKNSCIREEKEELESFGKRRQRKDCVSQATKQQIHEFFLEPSNCTYLPVKKTVDKNGEAKTVLRKPLKRLHKEYLKKYAGPVSLSKFKSLRPSNAVPMANGSKWRQCLCEYCTNAECLISAINLESRKEGLPDCCVSDVYELANLTMCPKDQAFRKPTCVDRKCDSCGVELLMKNKLNPLKVKLEAKETAIEWKSWKNVTTEKDGKKISRKMLTTQTGDATLFFDAVKSICTGLARHLFNATWQYQQFTKARETLKVGTLLLVADFAENFRVEYQDEIQAAHWGYTQITVHPIMFYWRSQCCDSVISEGVVGTSDDLKHDSKAAKDFIDQAIAHIKHTRNVIVDNVVQFTDGCPGQYKSKQPFYDIANAALPTTRCYFGSRHGKGPADGLAAVAKQAVHRAVLSRQTVMTDGQGLAKWLNENLRVDPPDQHPPGNCSQKLRSSIYVAIDRSTLLKTVSQSIPGCRAIHAVRSCGEEFMVESRKLACFCNGCLSFGMCENRLYTGEWEIQTLKKLPKTGTTLRKATKKKSSAKTTPKERTSGNKKAAGKTSHSETPKGKTPESKMPKVKTAEFQKAEKKKEVSKVPAGKTTTTSARKKTTRARKKTPAGKMTLGDTSQKEGWFKILKVTTK